MSVLSALDTKLAVFDRSASSTIMSGKLYPGCAESIIRGTIMLTGKICMLLDLKNKYICSAGLCVWGRLTVPFV